MHYAPPPWGPPRRALLMLGHAALAPPISGNSRCARVRSRYMLMLLTRTPDASRKVPGALGFTASMHPRPTWVTSTGHAQSRQGKSAWHGQPAPNALGNAQVWLCGSGDVYQPALWFGRCRVLQECPAILPALATRSVGDDVSAATRRVSGPASAAHARHYCQECQAQKAWQWVTHGWNP
jgi:hypothetical protein